jgi:prepilin-type processing-associated H-X9-DG protein
MMAPRPYQPRPALTLVEGLVVIAVLGLVVALLLPSVRTSREAARRNQCLYNCRQISLGLLNYESAKGEFPPAYTTDADGKLLHSWRSWIFPFMESSSFFRSIDRNKPWDDSVNAKPLHTVLESFRCPSVPDLGNRTNYLAIVTPTSFIQPSVPRLRADVKDSDAGTIVFMDIDEKHAVPRMAPFDADENLALGICDPDWPGQHGNLAIFSFADGHAKSLQAGISPDVIRDLISIAGDGPNESDEMPERTELEESP